MNTGLIYLHVVPKSHLTYAWKLPTSKRVFQGLSALVADVRQESEIPSASVTLTPPTPRSLPSN